MKNILFIILLFSCLVACQQPEVGYLSKNIHALEDTIFVSRGVFMTSAAPSAESSTYPLTWSITEILDKNGKPTDELSAKHDIQIWTESFNPDTDTTLELAKSKLKMSAEPSIKINSISGELAFTQASKFVENEIFMVNANVSNVKGQLQIDSFVVVKFLPFRAVEFPAEMRSRINLIKNDGSKKALYTSTITNDNDDGVPSVLDGTHPYFSVLKTNEEPKLGIKARMTITDSHNIPIPSKDILFYPSGSSYMQNFHDNSTETEQDANSYTFSLPAPPFPQFGRNYTGNSSYLMYYLSSQSAFTLDKAAYEKDYGPQDWSNYKTNSNGDIICEAYIRWAIKIRDNGFWDLKMKIPYSKVL
ncbi:MAG: DUF5007 domain-containing protein [Bacteroidales bacterium]